MALTQERLKELLTYSPETGHFYWAKKTCKKVVVGKEAGCRESHYGYILVGIDGKVYGAHRLAWLYVHGVWPDQIDHANGDPTDNRLVNLRNCTHSQNLKNVKRPSHNTSGLKGVHFHRQTGKWRARITAGGRHHSLGLHPTKELAHAAYREGALKLHGDFARFQ